MVVGTTDVEELDDGVVDESKEVEEVYVVVDDVVEEVVEIVV